MGLDAVRSGLSDAAILLDFDGTLSPIVADPAAARPAPGAAEVLASLAERAALVAIVTGRPESFIRTVLDVPSLEVVGLYGLEGAPPIGSAVRDEVAQVASRVPGAHLEDKRVSLSVHVRNARDPDAALAFVREEVDAIAARNGLVSFEGKRVVEIAPAGSRKGAAVGQLLTRAEPRVAAYAGDDLEDLEAFAALAAYAVPSCAIVVAGPETPDALRAAADVVVRGPEGLLDLLRSL